MTTLIQYLPSGISVVVCYKIKKVADDVPLFSDKSISDVTFENKTLLVINKNNKVVKIKTLTPIFPFNVN